MRTNQTGMTAARCPVTNTLMPNVSRSFGNFHISYCRSSADYGCDTTAIVLDGRVFFILNGNHAGQLCIVADEEGIDGCVNYFVDNIDNANPYSEHLMAAKIKADPFDLHATALEVIGTHNIEKLQQRTLEGSKDANSQY